MVKTIAQRKPYERGQAVVLMILSLSIFVFAAMGLAIDGAQLYAQRQMAQRAADAAAQAGIVTIFDGGSAIGTTAYYCTSTDATSPCTYSSKNGYTAGTCTSSASASPGADCIKVDPNPGVTVPGTLDPGTPNELQVTVTRAVPMTLMKLAGFTSLNVTARATAAILDVQSPVPILVTHPTLAGTLSQNGATVIKICGGPQRSIQVNSSNAAAYGGGGSVDLSTGGPTDTLGNCTGHGSDFGVFGGDLSNPGSVSLGTKGHYLAPADPIQDPFASVAAPTQPTGSLPKGGQACTHCGNCPNGSSCQEYVPGNYASGVDTTGNDAIFDPGVYYLASGGFTTKNGAVGMCTSCAADLTTKNGMVLYDTGPLSGGCDATGGFTIDTNSTSPTGGFYGAGISSSNLTGVPAAPYYGILYFEDRNACAHTGNGSNGHHTLGQGNSCVSQVGTTYITNTRAIMVANAAQYQEVRMNGGTCSGVSVVGEIVVSTLGIVGNSTITMQLLPTAFITVRQIALVNGE
jgi:hypothetical protein